MAPHTTSTHEEHISEVSETDIPSTTESIVSDHQAYHEMSLESLFHHLKQQTQSNEDTPNANKDRFTQLKERVDRLPKIHANLETTLKPQAKKDIVTINDPIIIKAPKKDETDDSGSKWFNMKAPEITDSIKRDLLIIKQRSALDPKRHYKKDKWETPKYFQMGTIVEGNTEFYSRMTKKQRGTSLVDEILHDNDSQKYFKRKYSEIQKHKTSGGKAHYKKVKSMRKKY
ncbi:dTDP-fucopyranose mutase [Yamadazyma tenuis]|uniref:Fcf2-domain-containing protein n=1 Tax=Candida tenuis (strain ATCC 10573 / BCRC 21748 / CBS 615 / JCM 9827 / NBRC 10315 / NRRL Y-1498 / VKM Y-70) TaxID=590646 RepID=G3BFU4_CANTC|nr:Fcf2-domain-containing protein [Yamadazyma tenuis ATCC 10573]EGV60730.1 Fcf2-domain-containing protein [Yamadazyma tenuis ATCC 10573]WEJ94002.1 dTDP-fucopyranose mutase [Yamadazyma tenuis]